MKILKILDYEKYYLFDINIVKETVYIYFYKSFKNFNNLNKIIKNN